MVEGDGHEMAGPPHRAEILRALREAPDGLDVPQLAASIGLHPNTIRWHLGHLADAGLVASTPVHRGRPGRPRIVYAATTGTPEPGESYRFLAEMLASALSRSPDGLGAAERAGRAWGGYLVERPSPAAQLTSAEAIERIVELLRSHGFVPTANGDTVEMRRCPFHDLVDAHGAVVCGLHRGLLAGALEQIDAGVVLEALEPYPEPSLCRAHLRVARGRSPARR